MCSIDIDYNYQYQWRLNDDIANAATTAFAEKGKVRTLESGQTRPPVVLDKLFTTPPASGRRSKVHKSWSRERHQLFFGVHQFSCRFLLWELHDSFPSMQLAYAVITFSTISSATSTPMQAARPRCLNPFHLAVLQEWSSSALRSGKPGMMTGSDSLQLLD